MKKENPEKETEEPKVEEIFPKEPNPQTGLIFDSSRYVIDEDGLIDWKAMIPTKYLFINEEKAKKSKVEIPEKIEDADESIVVIKLGGIRWLARVRGYESVSYEVVQTSPDVIVKCQICWTPNLENPVGATYEEIASCGSKNADSFGQSFAETVAANRAFVRCVRNFLNINIVGEEELSEEPEAPTEGSKSVSADPQSIFVQKCKDKGMSDEEVAEFCISNNDSLSEVSGKTASEIKKILTPKQARALLKALKKSQ